MLPFEGSWREATEGSDLKLSEVYPQPPELVLN